MKKIITTLILATLCLTANAQESYVGNLLYGQHKLQPLWVVSTMVTNVNSNAFVMFQNGNITFSWFTRNDKLLHYTTIPLNKLVVAYSDVDVPYVEFKWVGGMVNAYDKIIEENVIYAKITCRKSFWRNGIYVPLEKQEIDKPILEKEDPTVSLAEPTFINEFRDHPFAMVEGHYSVNVR